MYFYSHKFCYQDHLREKKSIFVSFPGNWFWHFHPYEKILMEDFVHSWTTGWCRVDSKVLEKINEVAKVLWGRIYFLIGMGWEGGGLLVSVGPPGLQKVANWIFSCHKVGARLMIMVFCHHWTWWWRTEGLGSDSQCLCSGSSRTMSLFSVPGTVYPTSVRVGIVLYCNQFALFLLH